MLTDTLFAYQPDDETLEEIREEAYYSADEADWPPGAGGRSEWILHERVQHTAEMLCEARGEPAHRWQEHLDDARYVTVAYDKRRLEAEVMQ